MGIKKLVTITVEVQIEIELPDEFNELTQEDIEGINSCGYEIKTIDDLFQPAAELILNGGEGGNWDVFGYVTPSWRKGMENIPSHSTFFDRQELYVEECKLEDI